MRYAVRAVLCTFGLIVALASIAHARTSWTRVTAGGGANTDEVSAARSQDGILHVAWAPGGSGLASQLLVSTISPSGAVGGGTVLASGWAGIGNPAIARRGDGSLVVVAAAQRSVNSADPILNQALWSSSDAGRTWSLYPVDIAIGSGPSDPVSLAIGPDGSTPFTAWATTYGTFVHRGTIAAVPNVNVQSAAGWNCCGYDPAIALDPATRRLVVAWYSNATGHEGVYGEQLDASTAAPIGTPVRLPGSATQAQSLDPGERTQIAARPGGGIYLADLGGYPTGTRALVWKFGSALAMTVGTGARNLQDVGVAADPVGRLWTFWATTSGGVTVLHARRSNPAVTRWGAEVVVHPPAGESEVWKLDGTAQSSRLDLLGSFTVAGSIATWDAQLLPGLSLRVRSRRGGTVTATVSDAGQPVKGAVVRGSGHTVITNAAGVAHLSLRSVGRARTVRLTAAKPGFTSAAEAVRVHG